MKAIVKVPAYWLESPETLKRCAALMVERWKRTVNRFPTTEMFRRRLEFWRDVEGSPAYFLTSGHIKGL